MAQTFAARLGEMRRASGWTLGQLAQQAGVSKSSLSRWEASLSQPRMTELTAVLDALGATPAQRSLACAQLDAPRALRQLRQPQSDPTSDKNGFGAPLTAGDLLRALRLRRGATQDQVAAHLGVARHTIARWELGERLPTTEQMHALCFALEAREEELIALTTGGVGGTPSAESTTWDEDVPELLGRLDALIGPRRDAIAGLEELHYISLDRDVWQWALREPAALLLLARIRAYHAHHHRLRRHWDVSRNLAQSARTVRMSFLIAAPAVTPAQHVAAERAVLRAAVVEAAAAVRGGVRPAPERGIRLLRPFVERSLAIPAYGAWILSVLADYCAQAGSLEEANALSERACQVAEQSDDGGEMFLRQCDHGRILLVAGRGNDALHVLPDPQDWRLDAEAFEAVDAMLLQGEARRQVGDVSDATQWLAKAEVVIKARNMEPQRRRAESLARHF